MLGRGRGFEGLVRPVAGSAVPTPRLTHLKLLQTQ